MDLEMTVLDNYKQETLRLQVLILAYYAADV